MRHHHLFMRREPGGHAALAVVLLFFGVAFLDSIAAHSWTWAVLFADLIGLAVYVGFRRVRATKLGGENP